MLAHYLALAASHRAPAPIPAIGALTVSSNPGFCNFDSVGEHASLALFFSVANQDAAYELHLSEGGAAPVVLAVTETSYNFGVAGEVENAGQSQQSATYNFSLQLVRKADGVVLQEQTASYSSMWGTCR